MYIGGATLVLTLPACGFNLDDDTVPVQKHNMVKIWDWRRSADRGLTLEAVEHWHQSRLLVTVPTEYEVIQKERLTGTYRLSAYWLAKMTSELPVILFLPAMTQVIFYPMCGIGNSVPHFFAVLASVMSSALMGQVRHKVLPPTAHW